MWGYTCRPISAITVFSFFLGLSYQKVFACARWNIPNARIAFTVGKPLFLKALDGMNASIGLQRHVWICITIVWKKVVNTA